MPLTISSSGRDGDDQHPYAVDPWTTESGDYHRDEHYVRATNKYNHKTEYRVNVPPQIATIINGIIGGKYVDEYRTAGDLIRDAIHHHLHYLNEAVIENEAITQHLGFQRRLDRLDWVRQYGQDSKAMVESYREQFLDAANMGDKYRMEFLIKTADDDVLELREPYQSQLRMLISQYGYLTHG